ncbi:MAG: hypothetical protein MHM6MM_007438 [Cercozoa sp. M6MM]
MQRAVRYLSMSASAAAAGNEGFRIFTLPMLQDNYAYVLQDLSSQKLAVVDPVEPTRVEEWLQQHHLSMDQMAMVLTTHKHWDHAGGNDTFHRRHPHVAIVGGDKEHVKACTQTVADGESLQLGATQITAMTMPCHTKGHTLFHITHPSRTDALFTGDTLFIAGCGRFFEGNGTQMAQNFARIAALDDDTELYVGHEYTLSNLKFAAHVEPQNQDISAYTAAAEAKRKNGVPTVPSTVALEKTINPFMRLHAPAVRAFVKASRSADDGDVMQALRDAKDNF